MKLILLSSLIGAAVTTLAFILFFMACALVDVFENKYGAAATPVVVVGLLVFIFASLSAYSELKKQKRAL